MLGLTRVFRLFSVNTHGCIRWVILTRRRAYKFPAIRSWRNILYGILNNLNEVENSHKIGACPVLWRLPLGLLIVMPRADGLSEEEFAGLDIGDFSYRSHLCVEEKRDSFGKLDGRIVAVDYGWPRDLHW